MKSAPRATKLVPCSYECGFTLIELVVIVAIVALIGTIITQAFSRYGERQSLARSLDRAVSALEEARSRTLASENALQYGVHFDSDRFISFEGDTFISGSPSNNSILLDSRVTITGIVLSGGGSDVVFERLSGRTLMPGTITFSLSRDPSISGTLTIQSTGTISHSL